MMKKLVLLLMLAISNLNTFCQTTENEAIKNVINNLFTAMRTSDTVLLRSVFAEDVLLQSVAFKKDGAATLVTEKAGNFIKMVGAPHNQVYDERITIADIKTDGPLASVWAPYKFYIGNTFNHCGVNVFQLMKTPAGWKIIYIIDTRRKDNCAD